MATVVERCGGIVLGSITDGHKINQNFCMLFRMQGGDEEEVFRMQVTGDEEEYEEGVSQMQMGEDEEEVIQMQMGGDDDEEGEEEEEEEEEEKLYQAVHPLDPTRVWFLLFDPVHLLKCIRNNWITEKTRTLSIDGATFGCFDDVRELYISERANALKTASLTHSAVFPSKLQLQNVQHVLRVFNEKVVAGLRLKGKHETADFIDQVLVWWKIQNVSAKGQDIRMRDPSRAVQTPSSNNLQYYLDLFTNAKSGKFK